VIYLRPVIPTGQPVDGGAITYVFAVERTYGISEPVPTKGLSFAVSRLDFLRRERDGQQQQPSGGET
jgi:hypothetical protein